MLSTLVQFSHNLPKRVSCFRRPVNLYSLIWLTIVWALFLFSETSMFSGEISKVLYFFQLHIILYDSTIWKSNLKEKKSQKLILKYRFYYYFNIIILFKIYDLMVLNIYELILLMIYVLILLKQSWKYLSSVVIA